ncbi:hypothetical protein [Saccharicrinis sp. FJH54]|uniref:hypothetical protein n=1 Tax=Saccharicrinis sp. FJH54 TaxID=3344665 RepID=UPI0035D44971
MLLKRITLKDASERLGYTDIRSTEAWCIRNNVKVYNDNQRKFVLNQDIERVLNLINLKNLQTLYPNNYKEIYQASLDEDYVLVYELTMGESDNKRDSVIHSSYTPSSNIAKDFFNDDKLWKD